MSRTTKLLLFLIPFLIMIITNELMRPSIKDAERPNGFTSPIALEPDDAIDYPYITVFSEVPHSTSFSDVDRREATLMHELVHVFDVESGHIDDQGSCV